MEEVVNSRYILILVAAAAVLLPPLLAWGEHIYLRHGDVSGKRKALYLLLYVVLIHTVVFGVAYGRGVRGLSLQTVTLRYAIKHLGFGCVCALIAPFFCCLLLESDITPHGFRKYGRRLLGDVRKYSRYVVCSAGAYLRAEVVNSYLDWLWWLIEPLCMMLIYTFIFGFVFGSSVPNFSVFVFIGLIMWNFFSRNVTYSVNAISVNASIITRVYLPKYMLLATQILVNGFKLMVSYVIAFIMMLFFRIPLTIHVIWAIPLLLELFLFTFAVGTFLMHYGVYVKDLSHVVGIVLNMMMYLSGVFYSMDRLPEPFGRLLGMFNPMAFLMGAMRDALLYGRMPDWIAYFGWLCASLVISAVGLYTIYYNENAYAKIS